MIDALIYGKLTRKPEQRQGNNDNLYTLASLSTETKEGIIFVSLIAFDEEAQSALLRLKVGEKLSVIGTITPKVWQDKDGNYIPSLDLVCNGVQSVYSNKEKLKQTKNRV